MKLEYKQALSVPSGATLNADFNAGRNLAIWDDRSCPIDFEKAVSVMDLVNLSDGVFDTPLNSMKIVGRRALQIIIVRYHRLRD